MRSRWLCVLLAVCWPLPASTQATPLAPQPEPAGAHETVTMDFNSIALRQAIQFIIRGRPINLVTSDPLDETITVKLGGVPWRTALESVLKAHGYTFIEEQGILRILRMATGTAPDRRLPMVLHLRYTTAEAVRRVIEPLLSEHGSVVPLGGDRGQTLCVIDRPEIIEVVQELLPRLDAPPLTVTSEVHVHPDGRLDLRLVNFPLENLPALLQEHLQRNVFVETPLSGLIGVDLRAVPWQEALRMILGRHGFAFRMEKEVVLIGQTAALEAQLVTAEIELRYANGWDLLPYLEKLLGEHGKISCYSPRPRGGFAFGSKITDQRTQRENEANGLARIISITDRPEIVRRIEEQVRQLDRKPRQVEVNVKIIEIRRGQGDQRGIDWNTVLSFMGATRPTTLPFTEHSGRFLPGAFPVPTPGQFTFGALSGAELTAVLRLIQQSDEAEVVSEPNITTLDSTEASILIGKKFPVTSETIDPQTAVRTVTLDYYEDIGIQLLVVPSIAEDDHVHMVIHPAVSSVSELIENRFPVIDTREADTQVLLRSGDTAVIGGLLERSTNEQVRKIPWLSAIPWLGRLLFTYRSETDELTELVIFVTPRIVRDTDELRSSLLIDPARRKALEELRAHFEELLGQ